MFFFYEFFLRLNKGGRKFKKAASSTLDYELFYMWYKCQSNNKVIFKIIIWLIIRLIIIL
jgi:hypothetical protein